MKRLALLCLAILSACGSDKTQDNAPAPGSPFQGLWLQQNNAEELRSTGRLDSICAELRSDPAVIINTRLIDAAGIAYAYYPRFGRPAELQTGTIANDGKFTPAGSRDKKFNITGGIASIHGDVLDFVYQTDHPLVPVAAMSYLRSSEAEINQFFAAQEACQNSARAL